MLFGSRNHKGATEKKKHKEKVRSPADDKLNHKGAKEKKEHEEKEKKNKKQEIKKSQREGIYQRWASPIVKKK